ncbi:glycosyl hydrolase family 18 protein [Paenibacillus dendritiformis]|uniref:glycoside hydrolase family 18 protein n=1 Tax=Paenibacillus dendritiformis TaxID=130049 RepID=UPI00248BA797|nr:glycosyl hydrolase family 18 protein [Paenibacillus dendritiformis]WGU92316.1 glycosyl hydrolase family 18 protein [Paenibacillus dendritiformis]
MKVNLLTKCFIVVLLAGMGLYFYQISNAEDRKVTAVYVEAWKDYKNIKLSDKNVDIAFIAFAKIDGTNIYFHEDGTTNDQIKENIKKLKEHNPKTKMVLAIGGYGADGFSDASLDGNRYLFTESIINMVKELELDGVDIDWEYPAFHAWNTQKARPEDTQNFTSLMKELREKLYRLPHPKNKKYLLTFASGTQDWYFQNVEVNKVEKYVDYINVMTYDFTGRWSDTTGYNSNLYPDREKKTKHSIDQVITMYLEHEIDSTKLLLGVPAYSYGWKDVKSKSDGAFSPGKPIDIDNTDLSYKTIEKSYLNKNGYKRYYDDQAKTAYLYNGNTFISYEDKEALAEKVKYIKAKDLGGAMVWEYSQDAEDGIVKFLGENLNK